MNHKEKINYIKRLIPDDLLRHIIFNFDDINENTFLTDESEFLSYFSNIMTFTTLTVLNIFLTWKRKNVDNILIGNNSFWRIYNILDKTYDPASINGEFIDDIIINIEIDNLIDTNGQTSFVEMLGIEDFFVFKKHNNRLSRYIYLLKQRRLSSRVSIKEFNFDALDECIRMFHYLHEISLTTKNLDIKLNGSLQENLKGLIINMPYRCQFPYKQIDCMYSIIYSEMYAYYMEDFNIVDPRTFDNNGNKNQIININYVPFSGTDRFNVTLIDDNIENEYNNEYLVIHPTAIEQFLLNLDIININQNNIDGNFFRDYILLNNNYLKNLSYTIADTLTQQAKTAIIDKYQGDYKNIFDKMYTHSLYKKNENIGYRWDEIILLLFLEVGVFELIKFLLEKIPYDAFITSFKRRFDNDKLMEIFKEEEFLLNPKIRIVSTISSNAEKDLNANAILMIASKLLTQNTWQLENSDYPTTIDDIIKECNSINANPKYSIIEKKVYLVNTINKVVRFIERFYRGVFQYSNNKRHAILKLETEGLYYNNYKEFHNAKYKWIDEIRNSLIKIKKKSFETYSNRIYPLHSKQDIEDKINKSFEKLINLNEEYSNNHDEKNDILFDTLGKRKLFSTKIMNQYLNLIKSCLKDNSIDQLNSIYDVAIDFLMYLKTGKDSVERMNYDYLDIETAIFPIVGQYYSSVTSRDGYRYSYFKINTFDNNYNMNLNIKMIIEDEFDFGYSYYCVPNLNRIARVSHSKSYDRIWISPIIIPCSIYLPQSYTKLETLKEEEDFPDAIELIYESDKYIYENLFGNIDIAKKVMPFLLNNPKSKFSKSNYYVVKQDKKIIAVASLNNLNNYTWSRSEITDAFACANINTPQTFEFAIKNISESLSDYSGKMFCQIDDVCVAKEYRHLNIGRSLMNYLLKIAAERGLSITLSVYSENYIAYNLYSSLGFVQIIKNDLIDDISKHEYIKMVKI